VNPFFIMALQLDMDYAAELTPHAFERFASLILARLAAGRRRAASCATAFAFSVADDGQHDCALSLAFASPQFSRKNASQLN
jgi:hypothetical protein